MATSAKADQTTLFIPGTAAQDYNSGWNGQKGSSSLVVTEPAKTNKWVWIISAALVVSLFFGIGFVSGFYAPHMHSTSPDADGTTAQATTTTTAKATTVPNNINLTTSVFTTSSTGSSSSPTSENSSVTSPDSGTDETSPSASPTGASSTPTLAQQLSSITGTSPNPTTTRTSEDTSSTDASSDLPSELSSSTGIPSEATSEAQTREPRPPRSWREGPCVVESNQPQCPAGFLTSPPLIVISFDGFRAKYLTDPTSNISAVRRMQECGVHAPSMRPAFPSMTFPNHYSLATGLYPESHGIVDNIFYDQTSGQQFHFQFNSSKSSKWWLGEPIWVTAKRQGKRANVYFWPGSETEIMGVRPDVFFAFNKSHEFEQRVDQVLEWISLPDDTRPDLSMMYLEEPDTVGHNAGPDDPRTAVASERSDAMLDRLMQGLYDMGLLHCVNIILVSDHGMQTHQCNETTGVQPLFDKDPTLQKHGFRSANYDLNTGAFGRISIKNTNATIDDVFNALKCPARSNNIIEYPRFQPYKKETQPRRFHYFSERSEPIILTVDPGYVVYRQATTSSSCNKGYHGYDNMADTMQSIFLAQGPSLKSSTLVAPLANVDVYNLMCDLIDVAPAFNNGTYGSLHHLLNQPRNLTLSNLPQGARPVFASSLEEMHQRQDMGCAAQCGFEDVDSVDLRLNVTDVEGVQRRAAPYGIPEGPKGHGALSIVYGHDHVLGYNSQLNITLWASFSFDAQVDADTELIPNVTCLRSDVRLSTPGLSCVDYSLANSDNSQSVTVAYLYPPGALLSENRTDAQVITNVVPMYKAFKTGIWTAFWDLLRIWKIMELNLNVVVGPIFDDVRPYGNADPPENITTDAEFPALRVPSHFFAVVTAGNSSDSCGDTPCPPDVLAFVLPHDREVRMECQSDMKYLLTNTAPVTDVEHLTGLRFFPGLPLNQSLKLRTALPTKLWNLNIEI